MRTQGQDTSLYQLEWPRWNAYHYRNGWIHPTGDRNWYNPTQEAALPTELARVHRAVQQVQESCRRNRTVSTIQDIEEVTAPFLLQFGFLGQTRLQGEEQRLVDGVDEVPLFGDHFGWLTRHAEHVDMCLTLASAIKKNKKYTGMLAAIEKRHDLLTIPTLTGWDKEVRVSTLYALHTSDRLKVKKLLAACLEPNFGSVERAYDPETGKSVFRFKALLQLVYWQLADWMNGEGLRQCRECRLVFFAHHESQEFCPPPQGVQESRCGRRHRMRQYRKNTESLL